MSENKVIVHIFGEEYPIAGVEDPAHLTRVAEYVDSKMKEASRASRVMARDKVAILAALSMASELLEKNDQITLIEKDVNETLDKVLSGLNDVLSDSIPVDSE